MPKLRTIIVVLLVVLCLSTSVRIAVGQSINVNPAFGAPEPRTGLYGSLPDNPAPSVPSAPAAFVLQSEDQKSTHDKAEEQMREQERQRVLGVLPSFNTSYRADAVPLSGAQKIRLAFRSSIDPVTFATAFLVAGYHEVNDDYGSGFGWGAQGYGKRAGAAYLDSFDGNMIGNGFLPALLRQDPRYFRLGHGATTHRLLYAAATTFICKGDRSQKWQPNISNVGGNIIAGAISNLYYPSQDSGWGQTIENGMIVTAEGSLGSVFQEFWPDISRKLFHRDPTRGLDAMQRDRRNSNREQQPAEPAPR